MDERQAGTPATEGWYLCKTQWTKSIIKTVVLYWSASMWFRDRECSIHQADSVLSFRGPLVPLEPSQGARELAEKIAARFMGEHWRHYAKTSEGFEYTLDVVTAAEQAAYERGRREERQQWVSRCKESHTAVADAIMQDMIFATDPPAQPAATEPQTMPLEIEIACHRERIKALEQRVQRLEESAKMLNERTTGQMKFGGAP